MKENDKIITKVFGTIPIINGHFIVTEISKEVFADYIIESQKDNHQLNIYLRPDYIGDINIINKILSDAGVENKNVNLKRKRGRIKESDIILIIRIKLDPSKKLKNKNDLDWDDFRYYFVSFRKLSRKVIV